MAVYFKKVFSLDFSPYLHNTSVAVKEQDVHISEKHFWTTHDYRGSETARHKKITTERKVTLVFTFLVFHFVLFWNHKRHSCYHKVTFDIYSLCYCFKRWPPKDKQGLGKSHVIPVNGSTPESLTKLGYDQSLYGLHSFRSGGATSLAHTLENNPSKERLLKLHGRWKTDLAKDMYIKESVDQRLSFVKNLGL